MKYFKLSLSFVFLFFKPFSFKFDPCMTDSDCFKYTKRCGGTIFGPCCCSYPNLPNPSWIQHFSCAPVEHIVYSQDYHPYSSKCLTNETDYKVVCADYDWECRDEVNRVVRCLNQAEELERYHPIPFKFSDKDCYIIFSF